MTTTPTDTRHAQAAMLEANGLAAAGKRGLLDGYVTRAELVHPEQLPSY